jgi:hypothetical protein
MLNEFVRYLSTHPQIIAVGEGVDDALIKQRAIAFRSTQPTKVYVSGPLTQGDTLTNIRKALEAGSELREMGCLFAFWELLRPSPYQFWMEMDLQWVDVCDVLLRIPGESPGADKEVERARQKGIPVRYTVEEVLRCAHG